MERKRVVQVDAQGRDELMKLFGRVNSELREAEEEMAERTGSKPDVAWRIIMLPASEAQVAADKAEKEREQGSPPL
jgi:DNA-binding transcriptional regulator PaaX